jgi:hypothetical protein
MKRANLQVRLSAGLFVFAAVIFALKSAIAAQVPSEPSIARLIGRHLVVQERLENGRLDQPRPYLIRGITWTPASKAPDKGSNPKYPVQGPSEIVYNFFYDYTDSGQPFYKYWYGIDLWGHELLNYWLRTELVGKYLRDISLMKAMNVNTVRLYTDPYNDIALTPQLYSQVLDEFYRNKIKVIITVAISRSHIESRRYLRVVELFKNHPAVLMWSLGNEWNLEYNKYYGYPSVKEAAQATNQAAIEIKEIDTNHPVSSSLGDRFTDDNSEDTIAYIVRDACPEIDIWGINVYRNLSADSTLRRFPYLFTQWRQISAKPFYLSEFGTDSFATSSCTQVAGTIQADNCLGQEDQDAQTNYALAHWKVMERYLVALAPLENGRQCLGGLIHEFNDELWKVGSAHAGLDKVTYSATSYKEQDKEGFIVDGHPDGVANEEYFGVVDADRQPKKIYWRLKGYYKNLADKVISDITPPTKPVVSDAGEFTDKKDQLYASWVADDPEYGIVEYRYRINQDSPGGTVIRKWSSTGTRPYVTAGALHLEEGKTYYFSVKARNGLGLWSDIGYSDGITVRPYN